MFFHSHYRGTASLSAFLFVLFCIGPNLFSAENANAGVAKLISVIESGGFSERLDAEKKILAAGKVALKPLLDAEKKAEGDFLMRVRRIRRMVGYRLDAGLVQKLAPELSRLESHVAGREWKDVLDAQRHHEADVAELATKIVRYVGRNMLKRLSDQSGKKLEQTSKYFLDAPLNTVDILRAAAESGIEPAAGRSKRLLEDVAEKEVGRLSDADGAVRERAEKILFRVGPFAVPKLEKSASSANADLAFRSKRLLRMIEFRVSPGLYERIGTILSGYSEAPWRERRKTVIEIERLAGAEGMDVLMAIIEREKNRYVKETAGAALLRTSVLAGTKDLSVLKFLQKHGLIAVESVPAITIEVYSELGRRFLEQKKYEKALAEFRRALKIDPNDQTVLYNVACCYSLLKDADRAFKYLDDSIKAGFRDWKHIEEDEDFDNIRKDERYKKIIEKLRVLNE